MEQANQKNQEWKDRHNVNKAVHEWCFETIGKFYGPIDDLEFNYEQMMEFALYFAERVKGAEIKQK